MRMTCTVASPYREGEAARATPIIAHVQTRPTIPQLPVVFNGRNLSTNSTIIARPARMVIVTRLLV